MKIIVRARLHVFWQREKKLQTFYMTNQDSIRWHQDNGLISKYKNNPSNYFPPPSKTKLLLYHTYRKYNTKNSISNSFFTWWCLAVSWGIKPCPGGVIYVRLGFDRTSPSRMIPIPHLFALPSSPIMTTIFTGVEVLLSGVTWN